LHYINDLRPLGPVANPELLRVDAPASETGSRSLAAIMTYGPIMRIFLKKPGGSA